jgi:hypothetical protein
VDEIKMQEVAEEPENAFLDNIYLQKSPYLIKGSIVE